jgi:hypothetical protein
MERRTDATEGFSAVTARPSDRTLARWHMPPGPPPLKRKIRCEGRFLDRELEEVR